MQKRISQFISLLVVCLLVGSFTANVVHATEVTTDTAVVDVIEKLGAIDTLQQMQDKRGEYTVKNNHYDVGTTDTAVKEEHEAARAGYEAYVSQMFAARIEAQKAYDALTDEQKAQIDAALVAKLSTQLPTVFKTNTYTIAPSNSEYAFELVQGGENEIGLAYEVGNHMIDGQIPQTFILVDTSNGETTWTPSGIYEYGQSNFELAYCCDVNTSAEYGTDYKRVNLEDSNYYGVEASKHIRAILQNSYPFVTIEEMKANLIAGGLSEEFVSGLTRADLISAVQMAVWAYANTNDISENYGYFATINVPKNNNIYFSPIHDYTNECWDWLPGKRQRTYDSRASYRVNTLAHYLCNLEGVEPADNQIVISDVKVTRAELVPNTDNTYEVGMYVYLNHGGSATDDLMINVKSYSTKEDGSIDVTTTFSQKVEGRTKITLPTIKAKAGDTIEVVVEGTQKLERGVYFYEPKAADVNGDGIATSREVSQNLVGVAMGETKVKAETAFVFDEDVADMGLRIYKTETGTGLPISDITFHIYKVEVETGENISPIPTEEEIAKYATEENKVASIITDATGYAAQELAAGIYLIVEEHNTEKVKAPIDPFYISVPMQKEITNEDGSTTVETVNIVSVYPKNEQPEEPEIPPVPPVPEDVIGKFEILKHDKKDESIVLAGAQFAVYRAATPDDTENVKVILCDGVEYAVVPVLVDGQPLVLTTDANGKATSPDLNCGTYFLVETKAPDGYYLLQEAVSVTVRSSELTTIELVKIPNISGGILPETGGIGTTVFFILGSIMSIGAVILLVTKKRMSIY